MKRSEIIRYLNEAVVFMKRHSFQLPPFAYYTADDWAKLIESGADFSEIIEHDLGWDLTDFGSGSFEKTGLLLFTVRNGGPKNRRLGKTYCEKIMISLDGQVTPMHTHVHKTEDIICRAGAPLQVTVMAGRRCEKNDWVPMPADEAESVVLDISVDGIVKKVKSGGCIVLTPGESVTLTPGVYHTFHPVGGACLIGEVSLVNDDDGDNRFAEQLPRFPEIEEDVEGFPLSSDDNVGGVKKKQPLLMYKDVKKVVQTIKAKV